MDADPVAELLALLASGSAPLAFYAAQSLRGVDDPRVRPALEARLAGAGTDTDLAALLVDLLEPRDPAEAEAQLTRVLGRAGEPAAVQAVARWGPMLGALGDRVLGGILAAGPGTNLAGAALGALGRLAGPISREAARIVGGFLADPEARVRANAAEALAARGNREDKGSLERLLEDPIPRVRAGAGRGVFEHAPAMVRRVVDGELGSGELPRVLAAVHLLGQIPAYPDGTARLVEHLAHPAAQVRLMAVRSLAGREAELPAPALARRFLEESSASCREALAGLAVRGPRAGFVAALAEVLAGSVDSRERAGAAKGIGLAGSEADEGRLVPHLADPDDRVRAEVVEALGRIGGPRVEPLLEHALADPASRVAANAALALWKRGGEGALERLSGWLRGTDPARAASAAFALGEIGSAAVVEPLLEVAERLRDGGGEEGADRGLLKQILKALTKIRTPPSG